MSTVKADNFTWKTGEATAQPRATVTGQQIAYGVNKAWVNFNGATPTVRASFNVSSITKSAVGTYQVFFTSVFPDAGYAQCATNDGPVSTYHNVPFCYTDYVNRGDVNNWNVTNSTQRADASYYSVMYNR